MNQSYKSIDPLQTNQFIITWDTGKRCNFDCSYCGSDRHDLKSPFPSFYELTKGVDFIKDYLKLIMPYRKNQTSSVSLTGGEPTANPAFLRFSEYLKNSFTDYEYKVFTILTTNGSFAEKNIPEICKNFRGITLSYHCDSKDIIKEKVRNNILILSKAMKSFKVNLMMHPYDPYWKECINLLELMEINKVRYVPRVINGLEYNKAQADWLKCYWQNKNNNTAQTEIKTQKVKMNTMCMATEEVYSGRKMKSDVAKVYKELKNDGTKNYTISGRHCCSKYALNCGLKESKYKETQTYVTDVRFKDWYCAVNWFFLHLESQTDQIYHHQTCQAKFGKARGSVGVISEYKKFLIQVKDMLNKGQMVPIKCPNNKCGCGLCASKADNFIDFSSIINNHTVGVKYAI